MKVNIGRFKRNNSPRTIKVQVDKWDTYNADHTLALIILPVLKQYKEDSMGTPIVDNEDVPHLPHIPEGEEYDDKHHELWVTRWDYVVDEMIWAFEQLVSDEWDSVYFGDTPDMEGLAQANKRIDNGLRLFGKYYRGLWT
jgi:hypothetical protein